MNAIKKNNWRRYVPLTDDDYFDIVAGGFLWVLVLIGLAVRAFITMPTRSERKAKRERLDAMRAHAEKVANEAAYTKAMEVLGWEAEDY